MPFKKSLKNNLVPCLLILLGVSFFLVLGIGASNISYGTIWEFIASRIFSLDSEKVTSGSQYIIWNVRFPRVLLGILVGSGLATAGASLQTLFRNPLADPGLVGISTGATLFTVMYIVLQPIWLSILPEWFHSWGVSFSAFLGAVLSTWILVLLSSKNRQLQISRLLLLGIGLNALGGAVTGLFIYMADDAQLRSITFWTMGSVGGATWSILLPVFCAFVLMFFFLLFYSRSFNIYLLGETDSQLLGVPVHWLKWGTVISVALGVGTFVAVSGMIGFVGLVIPHIVRLLVGPDHRVLIPSSALLGGLLLIWADALARTIVAPAELPIGILTSVIGAPVFILILISQKSRSMS